MIDVGPGVTTNREIVSHMRSHVIALIGLLLVVTAARGRATESRDEPVGQKDQDPEHPARDHRRPALAGGLRRGRRRTHEQGERRAWQTSIVSQHEFGGETPEIRRKELLPFIWNVIAKNGQLFGNANAGSEAKVTNGRNFSYPGYNEIFTGCADPKIDSNERGPNGNVTVLEWLNGQDDFHRRVAAFGSWDVFPYILNQHA